MPDTKIILCDMKFNPCIIRLNNKLRKLGGGRDQGLEWRMGERSEVVGWWEVEWQGPGGAVEDGSGVGGGRVVGGISDLPLTHIINEMTL